MEEKIINESEEKKQMNGRQSMHSKADNQPDCSDCRKDWNGRPAESPSSMFGHPAGYSLPAGTVCCLLFPVRPDRQPKRKTVLTGIDIPELKE